MNKIFLKIVVIFMGCWLMAAEIVVDHCVSRKVIHHANGSVTVVCYNIDNASWLDDDWFIGRGPVFWGGYHSYYHHPVRRVSRWYR